MTDISQKVANLKVTESDGLKKSNSISRKSTSDRPEALEIDQLSILRKGSSVSRKPTLERKVVVNNGQGARSDNGGYTHSAGTAPIINIEGEIYIPGEEIQSHSSLSHSRQESNASSNHISEMITEGGRVGFIMDGDRVFDSTAEVNESFHSIQRSDTDSESKNSSVYGSDVFDSYPKLSKEGSLMGKLVGAFHFKSKKKVFVSKLPLDQYIRKLKESNGKYDEGCCIPVEDIEKICKEARELTMSQPILLELQPPLQICGDIHGQFPDLISLFEVCGDPSNTNYLFLGDYVDRGKQSIETILLLMCYKLQYPETFFLLRGNHECADVNRMYGFFDECKRRSKMKMWKEFTTYFDTLPLAAVIAEKIFCVHGGLSPTLQSMDSIREVKRPCHIGSRGVEADLLWSDPAEGVTKWELNEDRGVSFIFGPEIIDAFLTKFKFELIVRAHMVVEDGYEFFHGRKLVTIFTAPNYCGDFDNKGAIMNIDPDLQISFKFLVPAAVKTKVNANIKKNGRVV